MEQHFTAFISYRHQSPDQEIAKWLHTALETYRIPGAIRKQTGRKTVGKCFRDAEELPLSPSLGDDIERALRNSDWLIAVCSPRYLQSRWCMQEVEFFAKHKGTNRILLVLVEGRSAESIPEFLRWRVNAEGKRVPYEPLAAEARGDTMAQRLKKLRVEKYRLLAPILGVGFDDLKRRARQRRIRVLAGTAAALLLAGASLGVYMTANHMKNERLRLAAVEQERVARVQRLRAAQNSIGEALERASTLVQSEDRIGAAKVLLEALTLSEENGELRRDEIMEELRRAMYIEPFAPVASFSGQNIRLLDIAPSPDGRMAVGIENGDTLALIDILENEIRYKVSFDGVELTSPQFSPDGSRFLARGDRGRMVLCWNTGDGSPAFTYTSERNEQYEIAHAFFWGDADTVLLQDRDRFYRVTADGAKTLLYTMGERQDWFDPEQNLLSSALGARPDEIITVYHDDYIGTPVARTQAGDRLLVAGLQGKTGTVLLDGSGALVTPLYGMPGCMTESYAVSEDGKTVACLSQFGFVAAWDGSEGTLLYLSPLDRGDGNYSFSNPAFSPDGTRLSFVLNDMLYITDARTGEILAQGQMDATLYTPKLAYSSDGSTIFIANQSLYIIDAQGRLYAMSPADAAAPFNNIVQTGDRMLVTKGDGTARICCTWSSSSMRLVSADEVPELYPVYDPHIPPAQNRFTDLKTEHKLSDAFMMGMASADTTPKLWFSAEGDRAAVSYADGVIELFEDPDSGKVSATLGQLTGEITALGMRGSRLVAVDSNGRMMLYDLTLGEVTTILNTKTRYTELAFDGAGDRLMALSSVGDLGVYDLERAELLFTMRSPEPFTGFAFAADDSCAVGLTESGAVLAELWMEESALLAYAKSLTAS